MAYEIVVNASIDFVGFNWESEGATWPFPVFLLNTFPIFNFRVKIRVRGCQVSLFIEKKVEKIERMI